MTPLQGTLSYAQGQLQKELARIIASNCYVRSPGGDLSRCQVNGEIRKVDLFVTRDQATITLAFAGKLSGEEREISLGESLKGALIDICESSMGALLNLRVDGEKFYAEVSPAHQWEKIDLGKPVGGPVDAPNDAGRVLLPTGAVRVRIRVANKPIGPS